MTTEADLAGRLVEESVFDMAEFLDSSRFRVAAGTGRQPSLKGFDEDDVAIGAYIGRCAQQIWKEGGPGLISSHDAHNRAIYTPAGPVYGRVEYSAAIPAAKLIIDQLHPLGADYSGYRVALRCRLIGSHPGSSKFGRQRESECEKWSSPPFMCGRAASSTSGRSLTNLSSNTNYTRKGASNWSEGDAMI